jgi:hypothetical protein
MPIQQIFFDRWVARLVGAGFGDRASVLPITQRLNPPVQLAGKSINPIAKTMQIIKICHNGGVQSLLIPDNVIRSPLS